MSAEAIIGTPTQTYMLTPVKITPYTPTDNTRNTQQIITSLDTPISFSKQISKTSKNFLSSRDVVIATSAVAIAGTIGGIIENFDTTKAINYGISAIRSFSSLMLAHKIITTSLAITTIVTSAVILVCKKVLHTNEKIPNNMEEITKSNDLEETLNLINANKSQSTTPDMTPQKKVKIGKTTSKQEFSAAVSTTHSEIDSEEESETLDKTSSRPTPKRSPRFRN